MIARSYCDETGSKGHFKARNISIANISCERSKDGLRLTSSAPTAHVGVQVVPMIMIYQEKTLFTLFDLNSFTLIANIKMIKFQANAHASFLCICKKLHADGITE